MTETKDVKISVVLRDVKTNEVDADITVVTWRKDIDLKKITKHVIDAIERIDV